MLNFDLKRSCQLLKLKHRHLFVIFCDKHSEVFEPSGIGFVLSKLRRVIHLPFLVKVNLKVDSQVKGEVKSDLAISWHPAREVKLHIIRLDSSQ